MFPSPTNVEGLQVGVIDIVATNRTAGTLAVGDVCALDLTCAQESTNNDEGHALSGLANVFTAADNAVVGTTILCVALDTPVDNAKGRFRVQGRVKALADGSGLAIGDDCSVTNSKQLSATVGAGHGIWAIALAAIAAGKTGDVLFNGFGFANPHA